MSARPLGPLEIAAGVVLARSAPLTLPETGLTPRAALEEAIRPALLRPPCLVSFSGGRDSSAILAIAADLARREGLPAPVPFTLRFPRADGADETRWQERVVGHLGIADWQRVDIRDELDCVGPIAAAMLRRHGVLWPCNAHFQIPVLRAAGGGSVLTGIGGDEALGPSSWERTLALAGRRARPEPRDVLRVGFAVAPRTIKRAVVAGAVLPPWPWLHDGAARRVRWRLSAQMADEPLRWRARYGWLRRSSYVATGTSNLELLAADAGAQLAHPLATGEFLAALAALPTARRFWSRAGGMRTIAGDVLPPDVIDRETKARFDGAVWTSHSREFADGWSGGGVDPALVDADALREAWSEERPDVRTVALMQTAWLARDRAEGSAAGEGEQLAAGGAERRPVLASDELPGR